VRADSGVATLNGRVENDCVCQIHDFSFVRAFLLFALDTTNLPTPLLWKNTNSASCPLLWTDGGHRNEAWQLDHMTGKLTALYSEPLVIHLSVNW